MKTREQVAEELITGFCGSPSGMETDINGIISYVLKECEAAYKRGMVDAAKRVLTINRCLAVVEKECRAILVENGEYDVTNNRPQANEVQE